jgi:signal transduction histidine kinase
MGRIPKELRPRIFKRFFHIPNTALAIAKETVVWLGGSIGSTNYAGNGERALFDLPTSGNGMNA